MGISVVNIIISIVLLGSVVGSKARATTTAYLTQGTAYWINYHADQNGWDMDKAHVACASKFSHMPIEWRSKYYWTAFCGLNGPSYPSSCGQCLKVTNPKNDASVVVRIVDQCGLASMGLDEPAFDMIDDGSGKHAGHLTVNYELVDCDPPPPPPPPAGPGETDVIAYWSDYGPLKNNWSYSAAHVACKDYTVTNPWSGVKDMDGPVSVEMFSVLN
ncbi:Pathoproteinsis-related protein PR-4 [Hibiscus syriacus]|uniref:Pathoproteinsis-related protein PR-4 n=1 Tax=Hibiscus syriacus TaxID=106335 RepID=A0A6A2YCS3_HIBSY|nr:Pathoproteinsis-related protein PR-4 [Hibiscus syriacus]